MSDVLEKRYASGRMRELWTSPRKYLGWRDVWIAVAEAQMELGAPVTREQVDDLRAHRDDIDYARALEIERQTKHDVAAHRRHYAEVAPIGGKVLMLSMTSDNTTSPQEAMQIRDALDLVLEETAGVVHHLGAQADRYKDMACCGYTHFQRAQPTTIGKRIALWGQEFSDALASLEYRKDHLRWGGIRGATGTQEALLSLFQGDERKIAEFERRVGEKLGLGKAYTLTGQTPPRSGEYHVLSALAEVGIAGQKFGGDLRLLWSTKQVGEPFGEGQVGSNAMAYKQNPSRAERMCGLARKLYGYAHEAADIPGQQWLERSLDDSAQRRINLEDAFLCTDAVLQLGMYVAEGLRVYPGPVGRELREHLTFAATENIITAATAKGASRDAVHERVRVHSRDVQEALLTDPAAQNDLIARLAQDPGVGLSQDEIEAVLGDGRRFVGRASRQVDEYVRDVVEPIRQRYPTVASLHSEVSV